MVELNQEIWDKVDKIDLTKVIKKLLSRKSFYWKWFNNVQKIEAGYRQFLYLIIANPSEPISPWNQAIDDLWHEHILDTKKYMEDCQVLFGRYIHHNPHLSDSKIHDTTKTLVNNTFGAKVACSSCGTCSLCGGGGCMNSPLKLAVGCRTSCGFGCNGNCMGGGS